ncbi:hypothetical protein BD626DRAFT_576167 [Schizophyllum amplum]|uniref:Uncharacterized protein n=1 Tax=Schizophyllum amplum TaxID=97359 RepID=A0A550BTY8_9AGAR|nr:hypothetical protein BD626DRAFT_576167 [Auriculariopsis ampla]
MTLEPSPRLHLIAEDNEQRVIIPDRPTSLPPIIFRTAHPKTPPELKEHVRNVYVVSIDLDAFRKDADTHAAAPRLAPPSPYEPVGLGCLELIPGDLLFGRPYGSRTTEDDVLLMHVTRPEAAHAPEPAAISTLPPSPKSVSPPSQASQQASGRTHNAPRSLYSPVSR